MQGITCEGNESETECIGKKEDCFQDGGGGGLRNRNERNNHSPNKHNHSFTNNNGFSLRNGKEQGANGKSIEEEGRLLEDICSEYPFGGMLHVCAGQKRLLRVEHMPNHLQFNTYVHTGYRDLQSAWDCFMSLFYLHNETVNILTHLIPIFGVLFYWREMFPWKGVEGHAYFTFLGWSHVVGSVTPWLGSVTYHMFMNHHHGPQFYKFLLQLDMLGIWVTQAFGALTNLTASTWCLSDGIQELWMVIYALASGWGKLHFLPNLN